MSFSIQTNVNALVAQQNMSVNAGFQSQTIQRLTSGYRINKSGDDAAGLAVANQFRNNISELTQGVRNANDGISQLQIMDSGMNNIGTMLDRLKTLATQSASSTFTGDRGALNGEYQTLIGEIDRQAQSIGLATGGHFAQSMGVYIGGGASASGAADTNNGTVTLSLASSVVDSKALGLRTSQYSVQSSGNLAETSVADIVNANSTTGTATATFNLSGPGFSKTAVSVSVYTTDTAQALADRINTAIQAASNMGTAAAASLRSANIQASVVTDGNGNQKLTFTSPTTAFQVAAGTNTANALLGNFDTTAANKATGASVVQSVDGSTAMLDPGATANEMISVKLFVNGTSATVQIGVTSAITGVGIAGDITANMSANTLAAAIWKGLSAAITAGAFPSGITAKITGAGKLEFYGNSNQSIEVQVNGDSKNLLGFGTWQEAGQVIEGTAAASAGATAYLSITVVDAHGVSATYAISSTTTAANTTADMIASFQANANYSALVAAGVRVQLGVDNKLQLVASDNVTIEAVTATDSGGIISGGGASGTAVMNASTVPTLAASSVFATGNGGDQATVAFSINGGQGILINFTTSSDAASTVAAFQAAIDGNQELHAAGLSVDATTMKITSANTNMHFRMNVESATSTNNFNIGFATGQVSTATYMATDLAAMKTAQGSSSTGLGTNNDAFSFVGLKNSGSTTAGANKDQQVLTFSAMDANGNLQSISSTLDSSNAYDVDAAVAQINSDLQGSNNATLQKIVAVKETLADGSGEGIRFISSLDNFSVNVGTASNSSAGSPVGLYDGTANATVTQGMTVASSSSGSIDISTKDGAQQAITALTAAVQKLGTAQASVGRGQNQLNYAIGLAQSQISNFSSAQSQIRDADVAAEAANLSKAQVLQQAAIAALAQANSAPQAVLSLLR